MAILININININISININIGIISIITAHTPHHPTLTMDVLALQTWQRMRNVTHHQSKILENLLQGFGVKQTTLLKRPPS